MSSVRKNVASQSVPLSMLSLASATPTTGVSVSSWVGKDGAALTSTAGAVTSTGQGGYAFSPSQADTNANVLHYFFTGVSCVPVSFTIYTINYDPTGTNVPSSVTNEVSIATSGLRANAFTAAAFTSIGAGVFGYTGDKTVSVATSGIGAAAFTAAALTSIGGAGWAYPVTTANVSGSFGAKSQPLLRAEVLSATSATVVVSTNATAVSDFYKTGFLYVVDGSGSGQPGRQISTYESSGTRRAFTFYTDLAVVPNVGAFIEVADGVGSDRATASISGEVSIATAGIRANAFTAAALASIAGDNWGYTGSKTVSVATSGIGPTALNAATYTSIAAANWAATTRLLTAGVTIASMGGVEVSIATSGIRANALTAAAITSIGAGIVASVAGEVSIAPGGFNSSAIASGIFPTNLSLLLIDSSGRMDVGRIVGSSVAALQMSQSGQQILNGTVGSGSSTVSVAVSSLFPVSVWGTDSFVGRSIVFSISAATTALRGTPAAITSSTATVLSITTIVAAPATSDTFIIV